uniref:Structural polyprotein n=1 Tax=Periplaneta americana dicistrovirus TaxID=3032227 RepID=A0AAT9JFP2_9VIRU
MYSLINRLASSQSDTPQHETNTSYPVTSDAPGIETIQVTKFEDAEPAVAYVPPNLNHENLFPETNQTLVDFLERPELIASTTITNPVVIEDFPTDNYNPPIFSISFPTALIHAGNKLQKLANFTYFKADIKVKLTLSANNMTSGRLFLCYSPIDNVQSPSGQIAYRSRASITSFPGVPINIQSVNSCELLIPYSYWAEAWPLHHLVTKLESDVQDWASLNLFALTKIRSQESYPVSLQLWANFENIQLLGPTPLTYLPPIKTVNSSVKYYCQNGPHDAVGVRATLQIAGEVVDSALKAVSTFSNPINTAKTLLSKLPTPSWMNTLQKGAAHYFGFSNPVTQSSVDPFVLYPERGYTNAVRQDTSVTLAMNPDAEINPAFNTFIDQDEMDIEYVCRNPGVIGVVSWDATSQLYSDLWWDTIDLIPNNNSTLFAPTCAEYVAQMFQFWRGEMVYRIEVVKTAFHTGRLEVLVVPALSYNDYNSKDLRILQPKFDSTNCYRTILDITNNSETYIRVPFFSDSVMLPVYSDNPKNQNMQIGLGIIFIRAITPLVAPNNVASTVDIIISKHVEDVAFSQPTFQKLSPYLPALTNVLTFRNSLGRKLYYTTNDGRNGVLQDGGSLALVKPSVMNLSVVAAPAAPTKVPEKGLDVYFVADSLPLYIFYAMSSPSYSDSDPWFFNNADDHIHCGADITNLGFYSATKQSAAVHASLQIAVDNCVDPQVNSIYSSSGSKLSTVLQTVGGDAVPSLRMYLKRASLLKYVTSSPTGILIDPYDQTFLDPMGYLSLMYRYYTGGYMAKFFAVSPKAGSNIISRLVPATQTGLESTISTCENTTFPHINPVHNVVVPFYSRYRRIPCTKTASDSLWKLGTALPPKIALYSSSEMKLKYYRCGKDDFTFFTLVGPPRLEFLK